MKEPTPIPVGTGYYDCIAKQGYVWDGKQWKVSFVHEATIHESSRPMIPFIRIPTFTDRLNRERLRQRRHKWLFALLAPAFWLGVIWALWRVVK